MISQTPFPYRFERTVALRERAGVVFDHLDDFERLGAHMMRSSWMMAGSRMRYEYDDARGRAVNALVRLRGSVLGLSLAIDERVIERIPPLAKTWQTIGVQRMLAIGAYRMGYTLSPQGSGCQLTVFIDYSLPSRGLARWLGRIAGARYARWCVTSMIGDAVRAFGGEHDLAAAQTWLRHR
jgi:hypothetical protein